MRRQVIGWLCAGVGALVLACSPTVKEADAGAETGGATEGSTTEGSTTEGGTTEGSTTEGGTCAADYQGVVSPLESGGKEVGDLLGNFVLDDCTGTDVSAESLHCGNKLLLLYFASGWCVPCREKQPKLKELYEKYQADGLNIAVLIRENQDPTDPATKTFCNEWKTEYDLPFPVLIDPLDTITGYYLGTGSFPLVMMIDESGTIRVREVGSDVSDLEANIQDLLGL